MLQLYLCCLEHFDEYILARVVRKVNNAIRRVNH